MLFCISGLDHFVPDTNLNIQVLNYALTLEHLENAFYAGALARFDEQAFVDAGLPSEVRVRFSEIAVHEATHVAVLRAALALLGGQATQPCTYYLCVFFFFLNGVLGELRHFL